MNLDSGISESLAALERIELGADDPPALIVPPAYEDPYFRGNAGGFVRLAIAALKVAQGQEQTLRNEPWVCNQDFDWGLEGLKLDPLAHLDLPPKRTHMQRRLGSLLGIGLGLCLAAIWVIGLVRTLSWIFKLHH